MYLAPLQLRESVFAVVCDRAKNDLSILTIFRRFPSRDVISEVLSNVLLGITDPDAGGVSMIIEAGGTNRDMVITSHQSHTPALSLDLNWIPQTSDCDGVTCHVVTRSRGGHYIPTIDLVCNEAATLMCPGHKSGEHCNCRRDKWGVSTFQNNGSNSKHKDR